MRLDPRLIIEFSVIAEEGSFTKAAKRLRVAQPWLSTRLRRLEAILGVQLFDRNTRSLTLTREAQHLLDAARTLAEASESFYKLAREIRPGQQQVLRVGAPPYTKGYPERREIIDKFVAKHPLANFELQTGWSLGLRDRLLFGEIDLAFGVGVSEIDECERLLLRTLELNIRLPSDHRLAGRAVLEPEDLACETISVYTRSLNPELWDTLYAPLLSAGARLIERPEVAEGGINGMDSGGSPTAFLDTGERPSLPTIKRIVRPTRGKPVFLYLLRRKGQTGPLAASFWAIGADIMPDDAA